MPRLFKCKHRQFHYECILLWLKDTKNTCPLCRKSHNKGTILTMEVAKTIKVVITKRNIFWFDANPITTRLKNSLESTYGSDNVILRKKNDLQIYLPKKNRETVYGYIVDALLSTTENTIKVSYKDTVTELACKDYMTATNLNRFIDKVI